MGKWQKYNNRNTQESQKVSSFPEYDHKATRSKQGSMKKIKMQNK